MNKYTYGILLLLVIASPILSEDPLANAKYIYNFFSNKGWTKNAICGMLGNMYAESGIKADIDQIGGGGGYGLVQWTPKNHLTDWANKRGLNWKTVDTQCRKIQYPAKCSSLVLLYNIIFIFQYIRLFFLYTFLQILIYKTHKFHQILLMLF